MTAGLCIHATISDHAVLQRGVRLPVRGRAAPGASVSVELAGRRGSAKADDDGCWRVMLDPLNAGGPHEMVIESGGDRRVVCDVLLGEVWLCSGQSNMAMGLGATENAQAVIAQADHPLLRAFHVEQTVALQPRQQCGGQWLVCQPATASRFAALPFHFGVRLQRELGVPVGLLCAAWGHTPGESWCSREALAGDADLLPILRRWDRVLAQHPEALDDIAPFRERFNELAKRYNTLFTPWYAAAREARQAGKPIPPMPPPVPQDTIGNPQSPTVLFNAMIAPLTGCPLRGALWYQGETSAIFGRSWQYRKLLPALIADWRQRWGVGDFPFLFVQLANHQDVQCDPAADLWAELRDAQLHAARTVPNAAMVVAIDQGESDNIHPRKKDVVAQRLVGAALAKAYGRDVVYSGPLYRAARGEGDTIRVRFDHVHGGLVWRGVPAGFVIAGQDRTWHDAQATIDGESVLVRGEAVPRPVAARYAWSDDPPCVLYNGAGLPASPFRTDDWPGVSDAAR